MTYTKTVLDNGLRILSSSMPHVRSASVSVLVGTGSRYESLEESGISHFVEHILFKGSENRPSSEEIAEAIEGVGGVLNGGTDKELTVYWVKIMDSHLELAADVLSNLIRHPILDSTEIEQERQVIIEEINMSMDSPQQRANILIDEVIWPDQPLGRDVAGSRESVSAITPEILRNCWASQYGPANTVVSVAGNVQHEEVVSLLNRLLGGWAHVNSKPWFPAQEAQDKPRMLLESRDSEQSHICLALRGISNQHPDRFAFDILNVILGEGMSCRLFRELREKLGLAYDVHSYISHFFDSGALTIYAGVNPANVEATTEAILNELAKLRDVPVTEIELTKAKEMVKGRLVLRMEDSRSVSSWFAGQELLLGKIQDIDEVISIVESVTSEDMSRVAGDWFCSAGLNLAVVGPQPNESRLENLLKL